MTLLEKLQSHKGGLVMLRSELYWYDSPLGKEWDGVRGRICLLLDVRPAEDVRFRLDAQQAQIHGTRLRLAAQLLIDGVPRWSWIAEDGAEVIDEGG